MKPLNLVKPHLFVVVGIPGAGKTFFAKQFSESLNAPFLLLDELANFTSNQETTHRLADFTLNMLVKTKQNIFIEGTGSTKAERRHLAAFAETKGYQPLFIWVQTEPLTAEVRAIKGTPRQKPVRPLTPRQFAQKAASFESFDSQEQYIVISGKHTYTSQERNTLAKLAAIQKKTRPAPVRRKRTTNTTAPAPTKRGRIAVK